MAAERLLDGLNRASPSTAFDYARGPGLGNLLAGAPLLRRKVNINALGVSASQVATLDCMPMDASIKAATILRAYARAGSAGTGEMTVAAFGATPTTGQIAVAPNGDIVTLTSDAITDLDVLVAPFVCQSVTLTDLPVVAATGVCALPQWVKDRGIVYLHSAIVTAGSVTGTKRVLVPGATNPATPQARLSVAKDQVNFTVADAVTKATITLSLAPSVEVYSAMLGNTPG